MKKYDLQLSTVPASSNETISSTYLNIQMYSTTSIINIPDVRPQKRIKTYIYANKLYNKCRPITAHHMENLLI